jgi:hypothetical protein
MHRKKTHQISFCRNELQCCLRHKSLFFFATRIAADVYASKKDEKKKSLISYVFTQLSYSILTSSSSSSSSSQPIQRSCIFEISHHFSGEIWKEFEKKNNKNIILWKTFFQAGCFSVKNFDRRNQTSQWCDLNMSNVNVSWEWVKIYVSNFKNLF